jgi:hypothetical protein
VTEKYWSQTQNKLLIKVSDPDWNLEYNEKIKINLTPESDLFTFQAKLSSHANWRVSSEVLPEFNCLKITLKSAATVWHTVRFSFGLKLLNEVIYLTKKRIRPRAVQAFVQRPLCDQFLANGSPQTHDRVVCLSVVVAECRRRWVRYADFLTVLPAFAGLPAWLIVVVTSTI